MSTDLLRQTFLRVPHPPLQPLESTTSQTRFEDHCRFCFIHSYIYIYIYPIEFAISFAIISFSRNFSIQSNRSVWPVGPLAFLSVGQGDQLRVGVTTDAVQAGALVAGHNLRGWCWALSDAGCHGCVVEESC